MITIADDLDVPLEPPVNIPTLPKMKTLGTVSDLAEELETHAEDKLTKFFKKTYYPIDAILLKLKIHNHLLNSHFTRFETVKICHVRNLYGYTILVFFFA